MAFIRPQKKPRYKINTPIITRKTIKTNNNIIPPGIKGIITNIKPSKNIKSVKYNITIQPRQTSKIKTKKTNYENIKHYQIKPQ